MSTTDVVTKFPWLEQIWKDFDSDSEKYQFLKGTISIEMDGKRWLAASNGHVFVYINSDEPGTQEAPADNTRKLQWEPRSEFVPVPFAELREFIRPMPQQNDCTYCFGNGECQCDTCVTVQQWETVECRCPMCGFSFSPCDLVMIGEAAINRRYLRYIFAYLEAETVLLSMKEGIRGAGPSLIYDADDKWRIAIMPIVRGEQESRGEFSLDR